MGLPGEDDLERPVPIPQDAREPVHVAEQEGGPLVGREPAGEADGQDVRVERRLELAEDRRRLAVSGELVAQAPAGEDRELRLLALVRPPEVGIRDPPEALPEAAPLGLRVEVVEVRTEVALVEVGHRATHPGRRVDAVGDAQDRASDDAPPRAVGGLGMEVAHGVRTRWSGAARRRSCRTRSRRPPGRDRARGPARRRRRPSPAAHLRRAAGRPGVGPGPHRIARCPPRPACGS